MKDNHNEHKINRRDFFKTMGLAGLATTGIASCKSGTENGANHTTNTEIPTDKMTYRTHPSLGDKVEKITTIISNIANIIKPF